MQFINNPVASRRVFITMLILSIVFFLGCGVLGFFTWRYHSLSDFKEGVVASKDRTIDQLTKTTGTETSSVATLKSANDTLSKTNKTLTDQAVAEKNKIALAQKYIDFQTYLTSVINVHDGFTGWTDAEFQTAKTKAQLTNNTDFISTINWAWYETTIDPIERLVRVWTEIDTNMTAALK